MKRTVFPRLTAAALALVLTAAPAAQALTPQQCGELLEEYYVDEVPASILALPTVEEMLSALGDPYTEYYTAEEYAAFQSSLSDTTLVGIGITYEKTDDGVLIQGIVQDSPAEKAGLKAGDVITGVDGHDIAQETTQEIQARIMGKEGTKVTLTYLRDGKRRSATLARAKIVLPTTTTELVNDHIGYINCSSFGEETVQHFQEGIQQYRDQVDVWVVDLRGNVGGLTDAAVAAAGCFTGPGIVMYMSRGGELVAVPYQGEAATIRPVLVLMDPYSASASEIFAAAIQTNNAGLVIGTRSYGKGVAQTVLDQTFLPEFFSDGDAIKITSHRFYSPAGNSTDYVGVIPDLLLDPFMTGAVPLLLASGESAADTAGLLRIDLKWRWNVDLELAASEEGLEVFETLLNALPVGTSLWLGTGGPEGWERTSLEELNETYGLDCAAAAFPDQEDSEYGMPVSVLKTYGLLQGKEDGLFHPQDPLTRAELCQMLAEALNCTIPTNPCPYSDVPEDAWYAPAVTVMSNMGLVNGVGEDAFRPEDTVDHQQLITIMSRLIQRYNLRFAQAAQRMPDSVLEEETLAAYADWAKAPVWLLSYSQTGFFGNVLSMLWDDAEEIVPTENATRDQAAYLLYNLLSYTGILPA